MFADLLGLGNDPIWDVLIRFLIDLIALFILIRVIFYRYTKKKDYSFVLFLMGIMIFMMCILLQHADISMGVGFGLFGLFSILRYRSKNMDFKTLAYFFTTIGISAINALGQFYDPMRGPILINSVILLSVFILEISFPKIPKDISAKEKDTD
jgi:phosphoglycerol transferase MdoB-like AlkP superfamily enzyme